MSKRQAGDLDTQGANGAKVMKTDTLSNGLQQVRRVVRSSVERPSVSWPCPSCRTPSIDETEAQDAKVSPASHPCEDMQGSDVLCSTCQDGCKLTTAPSQQCACVLLMFSKLPSAEVDH
jgi:hypothetical protein